MQDPMLRSRSRLQTQPRPIEYQPRPNTPPVVSNDIGVLPIKPDPQPEFPEPTHIKQIVPEMPAPKVITPPNATTPAPGGLVQLSDSPSTTTTVSSTISPAPTASKSGNGSRKLSIGLTALAIVAFGAGIFFGFNTLRNNRYVSAQIAGIRNNNDPDAPAEDQPSSSDLSSYQVPAKDPRVLTIDSLSVKARIRKLGVKANNELDAPKNIYDAGWYEGSSRPDEAGAMLIDGHVQGPTKPGIFMNLSKLKAGDAISVERGDGKTITYHVVKSQTYEAANMDMQVTLNSVDPAKNGLNIISCAGQYDTKTKNYTQRLVVFAVQD